MFNRRFRHRHEQLSPVASDVAYHGCHRMSAMVLAIRAVRGGAVHPSQQRQPPPVAMQDAGQQIMVALVSEFPETSAELPPPPVARRSLMQALDLAIEWRSLVSEVGPCSSSLFDGAAGAAVARTVAAMKPHKASFTVTPSTSRARPAFRQGRQAGHGVADAGHGEQRCAVCAAVVAGRRGAARAVGIGTVGHGISQPGA